jgi:Mn-dependent DtxR family transcriptional regulator
VRQCHTTVRTFLVSLLHVPEETADEEACKIEHAISDDTLDRLTRFVQAQEQIDTDITLHEDKQMPGPGDSGSDIQKAADENIKAPDNN